MELLLRLVKHSLKVDIDKMGKTKVGVPQGSPISPLYSNIYLNLIDKIWHKMEYPWKLHRFADDVLWICQRDGYKALEKFKEIARKLKLPLNRSKTKVTRLTEEFWIYLGCLLMSPSGI